MQIEAEVTRHGVERDREDGRIVVHLEINGEAGNVTFRDSLQDCELRGKWASHSGFRSIMSGFRETIETYDDEAFYARAEEVALSHYKETADLPFLVGDEHKDFGWKKLSRNYKGKLEIRLADWHEGIVSAELEALGITLGCRLNNYWWFEDEVEWDDAKAILAPLMAKGTRLVDERRLVQQLRDSVTSRGFLPGEFLSRGGMQPSLF